MHGGKIIDFKIKLPNIKASVYPEAFIMFICLPQELKSTSGAKRWSMEMGRPAKSC